MAKSSVAKKQSTTTIRKWGWGAWKMITEITSGNKINGMRMKPIQDHKRPSSFIKASKPALCGFIKVRRIYYSFKWFKNAKQMASGADHDPTAHDRSLTHFLPLLHVVVWKPRFLVTKSFAQFWMDEKLRSWAKHFLGTEWNSVQMEYSLINKINIIATK